MSADTPQARRLSHRPAASPAPSARQLRWHAMEFYGFLHFTVNTFTDKEWGYGDESPDVFAPTQFDPDQIVETAAAGGMKGLILTCKHHDGFCLWPSRYTAHSVKSSPWRGGQGDVVRDISRACERAGIKFGVYLSPWDRNHPDYARPPYVEYYRNQLRELLTEYGPVFEVWFDGANGGDGFYGGARERRKIDGRTYYGWEETWDLVRRLQPDACMFSDVGPDVRWVGNEKGIAGDPCWHTIGDHGFAPGEADAALLNSGERDGTLWMPAECDVSIRPGWFYHAAEDDRVRTPENLLDLYFQSVGRGAGLLLNLPPDRRGLIHERDAAALKEFRKRLDAWQCVARIDTDAVRCGTAALGCDSVARSATSPSETLLSFPHPVTFNIVSLREDISQGQRIGPFSISVEDAGAWRQWGSGASVGSRRCLRELTTTTRRVRIQFDGPAACAALTEVEFFLGAGLGVGE